MKRPDNCGWKLEKETFPAHAVMLADSQRRARPRALQDGGLLLLRGSVLQEFSLDLPPALRQADTQIC